MFNNKHIFTRLNNFDVIGNYCNKSRNSFECIFNSIQIFFSHLQLLKRNQIFL